MDVDHRLFLLSFFFLFFFLSLREYRLPFEQDLNCQVPIFHRQPSFFPTECFPVIIISYRSAISP